MCGYRTIDKEVMSEITYFQKGSSSCPLPRVPRGGAPGCWDFPTLLVRSQGLPGFSTPASIQKCSGNPGPLKLGEVACQGLQAPVVGLCPACPAPTCLCSHWLPWPETQESLEDRDWGIPPPGLASWATPLDW